MNPNSENLRKNLLRLALDVTPRGTLDELSDRIGCHRSTISIWINAGKVPRAKVRFICRIFGDKWDVLGQSVVSKESIIAKN